MVDLSALPVAVFLIPFGFFLALFFIYSLFCLHQVMRYGIGRGATWLIASAFIFGAASWLGLGVFFLFQFDWSYPLSFASLAGSANPLGL